MNKTNECWAKHGQDFRVFFLFFGSNDYYSVNSAGVEFLNFLSMLVIKSSIIIILWSIIVSILRIYFYT